MFFSESDLALRILSVHKLSWDAAKRCTKGSRPYHALSFRIQGDADFIHNDIVTHVNQCDIAFVPSGYMYELNSLEFENLFVVHFDTENYNTDIMEVFTPNNYKMYENLFRTLYKTWNKKQIGYQYGCKSIFFNIMEQIQKQYTEQVLNASNEKMNMVIKYIHEHFTDSDLTIAYLSELAGMSDTYFRKLFTNMFSVTPLKYINNLRISYALELLKSGYYSIELIADKSGFTDSKYFSTVIRKATGLPPSKILKSKP